MSKKTDLKFDDAEEFMRANPHLTIERKIPAHTVITPNYGAIRAILRGGKTLAGVNLAEIDSVILAAESKELIGHKETALEKPVAFMEKAKKKLVNEQKD